MNKCTFIIFYFILSLKLFAQVNVDIVIPKLNEGMGRLESLLAQNIALAVSDMETMVEDTLQKPVITSAFGNAASLSQAMHVVGNSSIRGKYYFSLGFNSSVHSYTFNTDEISEAFENLQPEDDFEFGVNSQLINMSIAHPWVTLSFSYIDLNIQNYFYRNITGGLSTSYKPVKEVKINRFVDWIPINLIGGLSMGKSELGAKIEAGVIQESFSMDPDDRGPLPPFAVDIQLEPVIDMGLETFMAVFNISSITSVKILDQFHFNLGAGVYYSPGETKISVSSNEEIEILGYLSGLIEENGRAVISGSIDGGVPNTLTGYLFSSFQFDISSTFYVLDFLMNPGRGMCFALSMGVYF